MHFFSTIGQRRGTAFAAPAGVNPLNATNWPSSITQRLLRRSAGRTALIVAVVNAVALATVTATHSVAVHGYVILLENGIVDSPPGVADSLADSLPHYFKAVRLYIAKSS